MSIHNLGVNSSIRRINGRSRHRSVNLAGIDTLDPSRLSKEQGMKNAYRFIRIETPKIIASYIKRSHADLQKERQAT